MSEENYIPKYEFRLFGQSFPELEKLIGEKAGFIRNRRMDDVYLLTAADNENNVKIRNGKMDMKVLEETFEGLERWTPYMIGEFPMETEVIKSTVFPALGIPSPAFNRTEYKLNQFLNELVYHDPDLFVAYTSKSRKEYEFNECELEITDVTINSACIKTICIESESYEKVLETKAILNISEDEENVNYPTALKKIMGLIKIPGIWENIM
jgi:hypothetical protein